MKNLRLKSFVPNEDVGNENERLIILLDSRLKHAGMTSVLVLYKFFNKNSVRFLNKWYLVFGPIIK